MQAIFQFKVSLVSVLFFTSLLLSSAAFAVDKRYQLEVNGLACPFCEYNIEKKLTKLDDISQVKVNLKDGLVYLSVAEGQSLPEAILRQEITDAGFTLKSIKLYQPDQKK